MSANIQHTIYVPADASAASMGAERLAAALRDEAFAAGIALDIRRNGSRGMLWMEPLVELETAEGRIGSESLGVSQAGDFVRSLASGAYKQHPRNIGLVESLDYFKKQERLCFARVGLIEALDIDAYRAASGFKGLERALEMAPADIVKCVADSGLRGRGGAAFPTGIKWKTVLDTESDQKFIVCNADEGDSGTFSDRMIMEGDPFALIEGMTIAGLGVKATRGFIYLRSEYPHAKRVLEAAIKIAYEKGYLGAKVAGSNKTFDVELRIGAGAYICGEETSLLESLEGKRGMIRFKPPLPAIKGLFGRPTVVNNVITLTSLPIILERGADYYRDFGMGRSRGTLPFQLAGNIKRGGLVEKAFGLTLNELVYDYGGGSYTGRPIRTAQIGGPLGAYVPESQFDTPLDYEALAGISAMLGHGGIVLFDDTVDMAQMAEFAMEFCAIESCGKCTPCRIGSTRGAETIRKIMAGHERDKNIELLKDLCDTMTHASLCALGGLTPMPVESALRHFPEDFGLKPRKVAA